jgi:hypothetical protein
MMCVCDPARDRRRGGGGRRGISLLGIWSLGELGEMGGSAVLYDHVRSGARARSWFAPFEVRGLVWSALVDGSWDDGNHHGMRGGGGGGLVCGHRQWRWMCGHEKRCGPVNCPLGGVPSRGTCPGSRPTCVSHPRRISRARSFSPMSKLRTRDGLSMSQLASQRARQLPKAACDAVGRERGGGL